MKITFHGAAKMVTGSKHLIEANGKRILLDCGMFQGPKHVEEMNMKLTLDPSTIDYIILSHAHIDHSGQIPLFVKKGFKGQIFCTLATRDLLEIMLADSGKIQEHDAQFWNDKIKKHNLDEEMREPLYTQEDAAEAMKFVKGINYNTEFEFTPGMKVTFRDAGHILGSSIVELYNEEEQKKIVFTGDLGRKGLPILQDPYQVEEGDYLITESTYGDRMHDSVEGMEKDIEEVVNRTIQRGGKIIIPAFSIGRTQEIVYILHLLWDKKKIPKIPIYVDSPLSTNATAIFEKHPEAYDAETIQSFLMNQHNPFNFSNITYISSVEESKKLNDATEPCIIISSAGMCDNGRIVHHLKKALPNSNNTILVIGYMAEGTLGRRLVDGEKNVTIHGKPRKVAAEIKVLNSFSAHADKEELFSFATNIRGLKKIFIVHGESSQSSVFCKRLTDTGKFEEVHAPEIGDTYEL